MRGTFRKAGALLSIFVGAIIGTCGLGGDVHPTSQPAEWGPASGGCRLSLGSSRQSYRYHEPIALRLVVRNDGNALALVMREELKRTYDFAIQLEGLQIPKTLEGKTRLGVSAASVEVKPGGSVTDQVIMLNRWYDMTMPGEYIVTASRKVWPRPGDGNSVMLVSNKIKVVVEEEGPEVTDPSQPSKPEERPSTRPAGTGT